VSDDDPREDVAHVGLVEFRDRHDTQTNGQHYTPQQTVVGRPIRQARGKLNWEVARHARHARHLREDIARVVRVCENVTRMPGGCYEETAPVGFRLYTAEVSRRRTSVTPSVARRAVHKTGR